MRIGNFARRPVCLLVFLILALGLSNVSFLAQEIWQGQNAGSVMFNVQQYSQAAIEPLSPAVNDFSQPATVFQSGIPQIGSSNSTQRLQSAVHRLSAWLGQSNKSTEGWRRYLLLNVLETQSALGEQANVQTLRAIEQRFSGNLEGLDHPAFTDVQSALELQVKHLSASQIGDINSALISAAGMYKQISIADMRYQRDAAAYELELLITYYRQSMSSRQRAELFYDLQLDDAIEFLKGIEFELAPEFSAGKVNSLIRDVRKQLNEVVKKIDALPFVPEPEDTPSEDEDKTDDPPQDDVIEVTPSLAGPMPEDGKRSREDLEQEKKRFEEKIQQLTKQRRELAAKDKPRITKRGATFVKLRRFDNNFSDQRKKLRDPYFTSASLMFERFFLTYVYGTSDNLQQEFLVRLESLQTDMLEMNGPTSRGAAGKVGDALRWFENANQLPNIVTAIRARHSGPNLYVAVSSGLVNRFGAQSISDAQPISQSFKGKLIRGSVNTNAQVNVEFQDDPNQIHASIHLAGSLDSNTYVTQRSIKAYTNSTGQLEARRSIFANIGGLFANDPIVAANVRTSFRGTSSRLRLVNKIAVKKFGELKAEGESTTARQAEELLLEQFGGQTNEPIENGKAAIADAHKQLSSNAALAPELYARSFRQGILAVGKKSSISTLAAPTPPARTFVPADIAVRVHETMLSNYLDSTFAGKKFSDEQLAEKIGELVGEAPPALTASAGDGEAKDESFTITFAKIRPIQFEFEDNAFRVVVSGERFEREGKKIDAGLSIALRFKIKRIAGKLKFVRDGKAELDYIGEKTPKVVAFRSVLDGKLNPKEGEQEIEVDLPENLIPIDQVEALQESPIAKRLSLIQCRAENGWLYLGWNYVPEFQIYSSIQDMPAIWSETIIQGMGPIYAQEDGQLNDAIDGASPLSGDTQLNAHQVFSPSQSVAPPVPAAIQGQLQR